MLPIPGQTAGPIGLNFFLDTQGWPGSVKGYKKTNFFENIFFSIFFSRLTPGPSASLTYICI